LIPKSEKEAKFVENALFWLSSGCVFAFDLTCPPFSALVCKSNAEEGQACAMAKKLQGKKAISKKLRESNRENGVDSEIKSP
jgi:hypothetical protein